MFDVNYNIRKGKLWLIILLCWSDASKALERSWLQWDLGVVHPSSHKANKWFFNVMRLVDFDYSIVYNVLSVFLHIQFITLQPQQRLSWLSHRERLDERRWWTDDNGKRSTLRSYFLIRLVHRGESDMQREKLLHRIIYD